ncbi:hypothetical protein A2U01_0076480, partial [Trifolium medium]|nr:hypothetical protein [Trifolium medium]
MNSVLRLAWNFPSLAQTPAETRKIRTHSAPGLSLRSPAQKPECAKKAEKCNFKATVLTNSKTTQL